MCLRVLCCPKLPVSQSLSSPFCLDLSPSITRFRSFISGPATSWGRQMNLACKCFSSLVAGAGVRENNHWGRAAGVFSGAGIVQGRFPVYPALALSRIVHLQSTRAGGAQLDCWKLLVWVLALDYQSL